MNNKIINDYKTSVNLYKEQTSLRWIKCSLKLRVGYVIKCITPTAQYSSYIYDDCVLMTIVRLYNRKTDGWP